MVNRGEEKVRVHMNVVPRSAIFTAKNSAKSKRAVRQEHQLSCASCTWALDFARDANVAIKVTERKISDTFSSRRRRTRTLALTIAGPVRRRSCSSRIMNPQQPDQDALQALQALAPLNPAQVPPAPDANPAPVVNNPAQPDQVAANQPNEVDMLSLFDFVFVLCLVMSTLWHRLRQVHAFSISCKQNNFTWGLQRQRIFYLFAVPLTAKLMP